MRKKLFVIEDVFNITGRGIVVTGELESDSPAFNSESKVVLVKPNGQENFSEISIEHIKPINYENFNWKRVGVLLKNIASKEDVLIGTKVFLDE